MNLVHETPDRSAPAPTVRLPLWQGRQSVSALWLSAQWLGAEQREARLLQAWQVGSQAWRFDDGDLLCLPAAQWMDCGNATALPLCRINGVLQAGPLTVAERARIPAADLILVEGAQPLPRQLAEAVPLDLSLQLDVSHYTLRTTHDLQVPPPLPVLPQLQGQNVREVLGKAIPPRSQESDRFLRTLHGERPGEEGSALQRVGGWWRDVGPGLGLSLLSRLGEALGGSRGTTTGGHGTGNGGGTANGNAGGIHARRAPARPSPWRVVLGRLAMATRASRVFGYRQGAHLRRMMGMFERGDLHEALRHALPLGGDGGSLGPSFGTPGRRESLTLGGVRRPGTDIGLDAELMQHLQQMYRAAFERLDRAGRIDEAVFVLAELLHVRQEALDYLVRHGRQAQAAELALGWDMAPAIVIRLLMLAGDRQRAVLVARRDNAFAEAIALLQPADAALADTLRTLWAELRARHGDWLGAVETIWPIASARGQALEWLLAAERAGGTLSVRALVQRAALLPATLDDHAARIEALLAFDGDPHLRLGMADALLDIDTQNGTLQALASHLLPMLAADRSRGRSHWPQERFQRLMKRSANAVLRADTPAWQAPADAPVAAPLSRGGLTFIAPPVGLHQVHDLATLPGGRYLVALGEAGAVVLDAWGQVQQRFAVPAQRLVIGDSGELALAVTPREQVSRVERLDLTTRQVAAMGTLATATFAPSFGSRGWTVLLDHRIHVIDAGRQVNDLLWHVDLPGRVCASGFFAESEVYVLESREGLEAWTYRLPGRRRGPHQPLEMVKGRVLLAGPGGVLLQPQVSLDSDGSLRLHYTFNGLQGCTLLTAGPDGEMPDDARFQALECGLLVHLSGAGTGCSVLVRYRDATPLATVTWPGPSRVTAREQPGVLLLHDAHGRWVHIDTETGATHGMQLRNV